MPPVNAGAGHAAPHQAAVTPAQLAAQARQRLALHLPASRDFQHALESKLHLHPFRGIVTAVNRGVSANQVKVKRTGQVTADANWYDVFGNKQVPIVGDEVLLQYLAGSPTAMVTLARRGGRPDEQDVPYSGGSIRRYDPSRNLMHKHGDDHHSRHYQTDGTTIAHHRSATGQHAHKGDHVLGGGGGLTIADDGTPSGTYHRKTHNNSRYEHYQGTTLVRYHNQNGDHGFYNTGTLVAKLYATTTGNTSAGGRLQLKQRDTANNHIVGDDDTSLGGKLHMAHAGGNRVYDHDGTTMQHYSGGQVIHKHDGVKHYFSTVNSGLPWLMGTIEPLGTGNSASGVVVKAKQRDTGNYHQFGDDNTALGGLLSLIHAAGNTAWKHDGSSHQLWTSGAAGSRQTGSFTQVGASGSAGGLLNVSAYGGSGHSVGDDAAGNMLHKAGSGGYHLLQVNNGSAAHKLTASQHIHPSSQYIDSSDGAQLLIQTVSAAGAIKKNSHSIGTSTYDITGATLNASGYTQFASVGVASSGGGSAGTTTPTFKVTSMVVHFAGSANAGNYKFVHPYPGTNSNVGTAVIDAGGSTDGHSFWANHKNNADGSAELWGYNNSASGIGVTVSVLTQYVN